MINIESFVPTTLAIVKSYFPFILVMLCKTFFTIMSKLYHGLNITTSQTDIHHRETKKIKLQGNNTNYQTNKAKKHHQRANKEKK